MARHFEYHVHVNAFGNVSERTHQALLDMGFELRESRMDSDLGVPQRMGIYTMKPRTLEGKTKTFEEAHALISADPAFNGYVESESCTDHLTVNMPFRAGDSDVTNIAFPDLPMMAKERKADIHVYLPIDSPFAEVDRFLLDHHFYLVETPKSRVYTLGLASMADAKPLYKLLRDHFQEHGGIKKIECEPVDHIRPAHEGFEFRTVAGRDSQPTKNTR